MMEVRVEIPDDLADALEGQMYDLMRRREINPSGPDETTCNFCGNFARDIKGKPQEIKHAPDCIGTKLVELFDKRAAER